MILRSIAFCLCMRMRTLTELLVATDKIFHKWLIIAQQRGKLFYITSHAEVFSIQKIGHLFCGGRGGRQFTCPCSACV